jgi:hypothetical protein
MRVAAATRYAVVAIVPADYRVGARRLSPVGASLTLVGARRLSLVGAKGLTFVGAKV